MVNMLNQCATFSLDESESDVYKEAEKEEKNDTITKNIGGSTVEISNINLVSNCHIGINKVSFINLLKKYL